MQKKLQDPTAFTSYPWGATFGRVNPTAEKNLLPTPGVDCSYVSSSLCNRSRGCNAATWPASNLMVPAFTSWWYASNGYVPLGILSRLSTIPPYSRKRMLKTRPMDGMATAHRWPNDRCRRLLCLMTCNACPSRTIKETPLGWGALAWRSSAASP